MELLPQELRQQLVSLYNHEREPDPICPVRLYHPTTGWVWLPYEGQDWAEGDYLMFGWVEGYAGELGYFALSELEANGVLRDESYTPRPLSQAKEYRPPVQDRTIVVYFWTW